MLRVVTYVDGFNLYHGMHQRYGRSFLWLDLESLARHLLRPGQRLERVRYFTAMVRGNTASHQRQLTYLDALRQESRLVEIVEGRFQEKTCSCRSCQATWTTYEEKESDVSLAVSLVEDAALDVFDVAVIVSADSDLCPAIRSVRRVRPQSRIIAAFPPRRHSDELKRHVDGLLRIDRTMLSRAQLPAKVTTGTGVVLERPPHWA